MKILSPINQNEDIIDKKYVDDGLSLKQNILDSYVDDVTINGTSVVDYSSLIKDATEGEDVSGKTFSVDTTGYTSQDLTDGIEGINDMCLFGTANQSEIIAVYESDGESLSYIAGMYSLTPEKPDGTSISIDNAHIYIFYVMAGNEPSDLVVLNDLTLNENYGTVTMPNNYEILGISLDHYSDSVIWNCMKITGGSSGSGTANINLKTINNQSIVGTGNINISGGSSTDVQINGTSITSNNVANIITNTAYNASSNKIATMSDLPNISGKLDTSAVKTSTNTTQGNVYDVTYINTMLGDIESLLGGI